MSGLVINSNIPSVTAQRHLVNSRSEMEEAMERLSSGKRINSAMDDAAGLTIAHSLDAKVTSLNQAARNANDAVSLINLAEGALDQVSKMLTRMRELAVQSLNGTYSSTDRANLNLEYQALSDEISRIADNTKFNSIAIIGSVATLVFQVGDQSTDTITLTTQEMHADVIASVTGTTGGFHLDDTAISSVGSATVINSAAGSLGRIDAAIGDVDSYRATLGAVGNRLTHSASNLYTRVENQMAARSQIEDADYATEAAKLAKAQVLQQAGTAMLAQANASGATILSLLK
jgi:flagellin